MSTETPIDAEVVTATEDEPRPTALVALSAGQMAAAQQKLVAHINKSITEVLAEREEALVNAEQARQHKWKYQPFRRLAARLMKRIEYLERVRAALLDGYVLVPNFEMRVIAIRTDRKYPAGKWSTNQMDATSNLPAAGEGRYVGPGSSFRGAKFPGKNYKGEEIQVQHWIPSDFGDLEFPVTVVRPEILDATNRAMARKVFDEMGLADGPSGVSPGGKRDPIMLGRIIDGSSGSRWNRRAVTFFVAWWLDPRVI